ncbi:hypothetical protein [Klebsiella phage Kpn6N]|nr:hypothetical protein [Klebsiella phage Kpn6N]
MNIFIGAANNVNAITVKLQWNRPTNFALGLCKSERDLMLHADFAYTFDERKGMWVWIKCRYEALIKYEYFSERDIQEVIAYHSGCKVSKLRQVIPFTNASNVEELITDFKRIYQAKYDERF